MTPAEEREQHMGDEQDFRHKRSLATDAPAPSAKCKTTGVPVQFCSCIGCRVPPTRLIKKYPNRRLYDTAESRYISAADLVPLIQAGVTIKVVRVLNRREQAVQTQSRDVTDEVLRGIWFEQERQAPKLTRETLLRMIADHG